MQPFDSITFSSEYRYGFHISKYPSLAHTAERVATELPFTVFQTYLGNPRSSAVNETDISDILQTREILQTHNLQMFVHGCLIYNLCGAAKHRQDPKFSYNLQRTCEGLIQELDVVAGAGGEGVIVHPNSCHDAAKGLYTASQTIRYVLSKSSKLSKQLSSRLNISPREFIRKRRLILENSAHEGGKRGWNLEELRDMIQGVPEMYREQIGICIDTAHAFGAGIYDFGRPSEIKRFYCDFERVIGLKYLKVFHLNDSMASEKKANNAYFGSCKDRHQNLGLGYIFGDSVSGESTEGSRMKGLYEFFDQARKRDISVIGEPPASSQGGIYDWEVVRELLKDKKYPLERVIRM